MNIKDMTSDKISRKFKFFGIYHLKDGLVGEVISIKENEVCIRFNKDLHIFWYYFKYCLYTLLCIRDYKDTFEWTINNHLLDDMTFEEINNLG